MSKAINPNSTETGIREYNILLVLADDDFDDQRVIVDQMVRASRLNLSIIIIGMGDSPFKNMHEYKDLVKYPLVTPEGDV